MIFFRLAAIVLPQVLIFLLVAASNDMLGGWNQTSSALTTVLLLFVLSPGVALALLVTEIVKTCKATKDKRIKAFLFVGLAMVLFVESLMIDLYLLSQLRM